MSRYLGLKRKGPPQPLGEENSAAFAKLKKQAFRPPFTRLKENIAEYVEAVDENVVHNKISESKLNGHCKFIQANGEALQTPSIKENLATSVGTLNQIVKPLVSERHESDLESKRPSLGYGNSTKPSNIGFSNTQFKLPGSSSSTVKNISLLAASKLNSESASHDTSESSSGQKKSRQPGDSQSVKTFQSAFRKPFMSRDLLNPAKENTENCADVKQPQYYSVLYAKRKKNTKPKGPWSDGVLLVNGRKYILRSIDDKVITKVDFQGCGNLSEGVILQIGMFHLEVVRESSHDEYSSGALFMKNKSPGFHNVASIQRSNKRPSFPHSLFKAERDKNLPTPIKDLHKDAFILNTKQVEEGAAPIFIDPYLNTKLRPHQREGVKFLFECVMGLRSQDFQGCLLADEMGLGKTLQVITLIWTLFQQVSKVRLEFKRALVVCPLSLVQNWGNEVRKWLGVERLKAMVVHGGSSSIDAKQQFIDFKTGNVNPLLITSYELLRKYFDIIGSLKLGLLVCDEAHRLKNCVGNKTIDALAALQCPRRVLLTGTPVQNNLNEFYAMMEFANPNLLGPLSTFKRLYTEPIERSRDRSARLEIKADILRDCSCCYCI
ncbi:uncharacterized protein LOC131031584 [Cryptomeria japonica]|uniref:uncharacterized protein LOC131031584 n=1 Tax=Cryptomeria japonica TaxID=3369 RepID=UPI0027DAB4A1|nr:uncharacterized protein LOC131031584 [Cryptomeria japonica]